MQLYSLPLYVPGGLGLDVVGGTSAMRSGECITFFSSSLLAYTVVCFWRDEA